MGTRIIFRRAMATSSQFGTVGVNRPGFILLEEKKRIVLGIICCHSCLEKGCVAERRRCGKCTRFTVSVELRRNMLQEIYVTRDTPARCCTLYADTQASQQASSHGFEDGRRESQLAGRRNLLYRRTGGFGCLFTIFKVGMNVAHHPFACPSTEVQMQG